MGVTAVDPSIVSDPPERVLGYSVGGEGKTRLFTSLTERWGEMIYIAVDEGSESLDSVLPEFRSRIHVYRPDGNNPLEDAAAIVHTDWKKLHPNAKTIIVDTFSTWTWNALQYITNQGMFSSKRVRIGEGTKQETALPDVGEYGAVHAQIRLFLTNLFNVQRNMNIIVICHSDPPEAGRGKGGPSTVGKKMTEWLPARFKTVIHIDREVSKAIVGGQIVESSKRIAWCSPHGEWIARINEASEKGNPLTAVPLAVNPKHFWVTYDNLKLGGTK